MRSRCSTSDSRKKHIVYGAGVTGIRAAELLTLDGIQFVSSFTQWFESPGSVGIVVDRDGVVGGEWLMPENRQRQLQSTPYLLPKAGLTGSEIVAELERIANKHQIRPVKATLQALTVKEDGNFTCEVSDDTTEYCIKSGGEVKHHFCIGNKHEPKVDAAAVGCPNYHNANDIHRQPESQQQIFEGKRIVLQGGGATALEMLEMALQYGAKGVSIVSVGGMGPILPKMMVNAMAKAAFDPTTFFDCSRRSNWAHIARGWEAFMDKLGLSKKAFPFTGLKDGRRWWNIAVIPSMNDAFFQCLHAGFLEPVYTGRLTLDNREGKLAVVNIEGDTAEDKAHISDLVDDPNTVVINCAGYKCNNMTDKLWVHGSFVTTRAGELLGTNFTNIDKPKSKTPVDPETTRMGGGARTNIFPLTSIDAGVKVMMPLALLPQDYVERYLIPHFIQYNPNLREIIQSQDASFHDYIGLFRALLVIDSCQAIKTLITVATSFLSVKKLQPSQREIIQQYWNGWEQRRKMLGQWQQRHQQEVPDFEKKALPHHPSIASTDVRVSMEESSPQHELAPVFLSIA